MKWGIIGASERSSQEDYNLFLNGPAKRIMDLDVVISGGHYCGGDLFAEVFARDRGRTIIIYQPLWGLKGREFYMLNGKRHRLGPTSARNKRIADNSDKLIAFVNGVRIGGTEETIMFYLRRLKLTEAQAVEQDKLILL